MRQDGAKDGGKHVAQRMLDLALADGRDVLERVDLAHEFSCSQDLDVGGHRQGQGAHALAQL